jgi:hypothetical protein
MTKLTRSKTEEYIRRLAGRFQIAYSETATDRLAHHMSRLAGDTIEFDDIERLLVGLQRAGHLSRADRRD